MKKSKQNKGITLVALVVTIVVLIILAVISINVVFKEDGVINRANQAKQLQEVSQIKEELELTKVPLAMDKKLNLDNYLEELEKEKDRYNVTEIEKIDENKATVIVDGKYEFIIIGEGNKEVIIEYQGEVGTGLLELSETEGTIMYPDTITFEIAKNISGGELKVKSSDESIATASISGTTVTITPKAVVTDKKVTITVTSEANGKYGRQKATYTVTVLYVGCYADIDANGTVDGVIYADLAVAKSGQWANSNGSYSYSAQTGLKNYYISARNYAGKFGTKDVLSPVSGTAGNDRFYVMALSDIDASSHTWYKSVSYPGMSDYSSTTSVSFGSGKQNTINMVKKWNNSSYGSQTSSDMWGIIQGSTTYPLVTSTSDSGKWFVPSRSEWGAFASAFSITRSNYNSSFGLGGGYWSSSHDDFLNAWLF